MNLCLEGVSQYWSVIINLVICVVNYVVVCSLQKIQMDSNCLGVSIPSSVL